MQIRENALNNWLENIIGHVSFKITPVAGDASFRKYFRLHLENGHTKIIMDAPPSRENILPFINIAKLLVSHGIHAPTIYAYDQELGFVLLEDLSDSLLLSQLIVDNSDNLAKLAVDTLLQMQTIDASALPKFDKEFILTELGIFREWFVLAWLNISLTDAEELLLNNVFDWLAEQIIQQPQVFIHRDYHSRNLIVTQVDDLSVIDFQDAMLGPISYDLVSLLKDCYIQWPEAKLQQWLSYFYNRAQIDNISLVDFTRFFELCGIQRHLKVLGVFCRLSLRDNKPDYLHSLPLIFNYLKPCLEKYPELGAFYLFMQTRVNL
jgi:aminoglycoside/choline kinase family phosphotransferase